MVSETSGRGWGGTGQGRTMVKFGRPWDAPLCVSEVRKDSLRVPLERLAAQGMRVACFTNVPNRGMADLVWEVLGGTVEAPRRGLLILPRETAFLGMCPMGLSKIPQRVGLETPTPLPGTSGTHWELCWA